MDWDTFNAILSNPLVVASITLTISLLAQWIFANWRIKRDFRIKLLEETFNPLYKLVKDVLERTEKGKYDDIVWGAPEQLREIILTDVRFTMLKNDEKTMIQNLETLLIEYTDTTWKATQKLHKVWNTLKSTTQRIPLEGELWTAFMVKNGDTAEERIQKQNLTQEDKKAFLEMVQITRTQFEATPEYQEYRKTREKALAILHPFIESLTNWANRMFRLISR